MKVGITYQLEDAPAPELDIDSIYKRWLPKATAIAAKLQLEDPAGSGSDVLADFLLVGKYHERWRPGKGQTLDSFIYTMVHQRLLKHLAKQKRRAKHHARPTVRGHAGKPDQALVETLAEEDPELDAVLDRFDMALLLEHLTELDHGRSVARPTELLRYFVGAADDGAETYDTHLGRVLNVSRTVIQAQRHKLLELLEAEPELAHWFECP